MIESEPKNFETAQKIAALKIISQKAQDWLYSVYSVPEAQRSFMPTVFLAVSGTDNFYEIFESNPKERLEKYRWCYTAQGRKDADLLRQGFHVSLYEVSSTTTLLTPIHINTLLYIKGVNVARYSSLVDEDSYWVNDLQTPLSFLQKMAADLKREDLELFTVQQNRLSPFVPNEASRVA